MEDLHKEANAVKPNQKCSHLKGVDFYNPVWSHFQTILAEVFSDIDITQDEELDKALYVPVGKPTITQFPEEFRSDVRKLRATGTAIGENEKELMDYLVLRQFDGPLFLVGAVGTGKSTVLRHLRRYVLPETDIGRNTEIVYVDLNMYASGITSSDKTTVESVVTTHIAFQLRRFLDRDYKIAFWDFALRNVKCFAPHADYIADFEAIVDDKKELHKLILEVRNAFAESEPVQYWFANLLFLHIHQKRNVLLILDNLDVLPLPIQLEAVALAHTFTSIDPELYEILPQDTDTLIARGLKCIVGIRPSARFNLLKKLAARMDLFGSIKPPSTRDAIKRRITYATQHPKTRRLLEDLRREPLEQDGKRFLYKDIERTLNCLHTSLVSRYALDAFQALSNRNIRVVMALSGRFLRSHAIPNRYLSSALFSQYIDVGLPPHLFTRALILGSNAVYWEEHIGALVDIVNVFDAPMLPGTSGENDEQMLAPFRLLSYFASNTTPETSVPRHTMAGFRELYPSLDLDRLLKKWLHFGLLQSPEVCTATNFDEFCKNLGISMAGSFYYAELLSSFSYLQCIKDDCDVGLQGIPPLHETLYNAKKTAKAVLDFCEEMMDKEEAETTRLSEASELIRYKFGAWCGETPCVTHQILLGLRKQLKRIADKDSSVAPQLERCRELAAKAKKMKATIHKRIWHVRP